MSINEEIVYRESTWAELISSHNPDKVSAGVLNELKIFYGGRGIWVDKERTGKLIGCLNGITVGLLHSGALYADDLFDDGAIYHYPKTKMPGRDRSEIEATKAAGRLGLPIFFTIVPKKGQDRVVKRAWVANWDDDLALFFISFNRDPGQFDATRKTVDDDFALTVQRSSEERKVNRPKRAAKFKFDVLRYYGKSQCCMCGIRASQLLDAAHIVDVSAGGSDHRKNGLILCASHHRAFDARLVAINPETYELLATTDDLKLEQLGIQCRSLNHLAQKPHRKALEWRWSRWQNRPKYS